MQTDQFLARLKEICHQEPRGNAI